MELIGLELGPCPNCCGRAAVMRNDYYSDAIEDTIKQILIGCVRCGYSLGVNFSKEEYMPRAIEIAASRWDELYNESREHLLGYENGGSGI